MNNRPILILLLVFIGISVPGFSQTDPRFYEYPQNHLKWYSIESEHFIVHFQEGNSRTAQVTSRIAEEIYEPITSLYKYEPDSKVSIILKDREDYSNGAAYFFDNKIDIWVPSLDTPLRGTHNWLRNVITHEFVHIVQIQTALKRKRKYPALYLQWLSYEKVRRPDVLYGFPNGIASLPFASINIPAWFAEGTAQYQIEGLLYDTWDSHRDMILRTRILSDTYFNLAEMGTFSSKTSLERETVYNQGYAFVIYLVERFGEDVLRRISEALGEKGVYKVEEAMEMATGFSGEEIFDDWITERKEFYNSGIAGISFTESEYIEKEGFFNFFPKRSPTGDAVAYLSNRGRDFSLLTLYIKQDGEEIEIAQVDQRDHHVEHNHADALKPLVMALNTTYSFSPDGQRIAYTINKKNHFGEFYSDLFIYELESGKSTRLTKSARIQSPAWSPDGSQIAALKYDKGTQNLILIDADDPDSSTSLTSFQDGETLFTPNWHPSGNRLYFSFADFWGRSIRSIEVSSKATQTILEGDFVDYRDPFITEDGEYMYYASDPDGIFNIYRQHLENGETQQVTSVLGGAFMPFIEEGQLYFSEYEKDGYKIKTANLLPSSSPISYGSYMPVSSEVPFESESTIDVEYLNDFNDKDINAFGEDIPVPLKTEPHKFEIETQGESNERVYRPYEDTFTSFSYFPVLRFDNYTKENGQNGTLLKNGQVARLGENLLRDVKPGIYFASRDVLDKLSIFGGIMLGVASRDASSIGDFFKPNRLLKLDRDAFFTAEYRGLPFIKKSWSPTVAVEVFNLHRNVKDGLSIEEFPCTSCLPDTTTVDIGYEVWEANLFFRSKLSRRSLLELGIGYSPYQVQTDNFFSRELNALISGSSSQYYKATTLSASYTFDYYSFSTDGDIAPIGLKGYLRYQYQPAQLLEEYEIKDGALVPIFNSIKNHSTELHLRYGFRTFGDQAFQARIRGFSYFNKPDDAFYTDYIGGFLGMRSYPFFAIGGNTTAFTSISWFTPIFKNINKQVGPYTFDKMYARFFFEAGNGWYPGGIADNNPNLLDSGKNIKKGIGAELRLASSGYYLFPLRFFVSASYGFDKFTLTLPEDFVTGSQSNRVTYGRELLFHFGLTFDFELL